MSDVVRLIGGPMDGWVVKPDAPALDLEWGRQTSGQAHAYFLSGQDEDGTQTATWSVTVDVRTYGDPGPVYIAGEPVDEDEEAVVTAPTERFRAALASATTAIRMAVGEAPEQAEWLARAETILGRPLSPSEHNVVLVARQASLDAERMMTGILSAMSASPEELERVANEIRRLGEADTP